MPVYEYKGIIGEKNTYTDGVIEAINDDEAAFRLREQKIIIIDLKKSKKKSSGTDKKKKSENASGGILSKIPFLGGGGTVKPQEVMLFSKKIATMIRAGLPIIDSLEMTENQVTDKKMKPIILSTGMSTLSNIEDATNVILNCGNPNIILLHCNSSYPDLL